MDSKLRTPNSELRTVFRRRNSFDEILLQLTRTGLSTQPTFSRKVLFWGEGIGEISSYVAGWLAGKGIAVIVVDGANRFDPYTVSSLARRACIPPEKLLKSIWIARAFTCYQMATLMGEQLISLLEREGTAELPRKPWVILLGPLPTFLDEDVPEKEAHPLFERSLKKIEEMAARGVPFLLFQSSGFSENSPFSLSVSSRTDFAKGGLGGLRNSKRTYLMRRLFQFSNLVWRISLEDERPRVILEKGSALNIIENCKLQNEKCKFERGNLTACW
jgi:hypothetical protein